MADQTEVESLRAQLRAAEQKVRDQQGWLKTNEAATELVGKERDAALARARAAEEDGQRDLAEMRRFQALYIKADHARIAAEEAKERAERERDEVLTAHRSLLTELWDGVRAHGLTAPAKGRDGERLIHAYCGGIAALRVQIEEAVGWQTELECVIDVGSGGRPPEDFEPVRPPDSGLGWMIKTLRRATAAEGALREAREVCLDASLAFLSMHQQAAAARADNAVRAIDRLLGKPTTPPPETP